MRLRLIIAAFSGALAALTAVTAYLGYLWMFTGFLAPDDEGYMLLSLRSFVSGQALYDKLIVQYGPFFFEVFGFLGLLGVPFDHDSGRLISLVIWVAIALLAGIAVIAFTRNLALGLCTQLITFAAAGSLTNEPMHPGGLVLLLVIGIPSIALISQGRWSGPWPFAVMGALAAAAILTKVNVGFFAAISIGYAAAVSFPALARNRPVRLLAAAGFVSVPLLLMRSDLYQAWAQRYAFHVAFCALALVVVTSTSRADPNRRMGELGWLFAGGSALAIVVLVIALFTGSSPNGLLHGIILSPLQQARAFEFPLTLPGSTLAWDAVGVGGAFLWTLYRLVAKRPEVAIEGWIRVVVGLLMWLMLLGGIHVPGVFQLSSLNQPLVLPLSLAWLAAAPRGMRDGYQDLDFARALVPAVAILQSLHAFPVAGSQVAFAALALVLVGAACINDGLAQLAEVGLGSVRLQLATALLFLAMAVSWLPPALQQSRASYAAAVPLGLSGALRVHVPADQATFLRDVTQSLRDHCDTFISVPGVDSFYVFGQLSPPAGMNLTRWIWLTHDVVEQQAAVAASSRVNRLCVVENDALIVYWSQGRQVPDGPLLDYIRQGFVPGYSFGPYSVLVRGS